MKKLLLVSVLFSLFPGVSMAYVGPGLGMGVIGVAVGIIFAVFLVIVGVFWYPVKRLINSKKISEEKQSQEKN